MAKKATPAGEAHTDLVFITKYRGQQFRAGFHDYKIVRGGLQVFPRLVASEHAANVAQTRIPSDLPTLDELLGGGLEKGTSTLFVGAPGTPYVCSPTVGRLAAAAEGRVDVRVHGTFVRSARIFHSFDFIPDFFAPSVATIATFHEYLIWSSVVPAVPCTT